MSTQAKAVLTGTIILGAFVPTPAGGHPTWNEFRDNHLDLAAVVEPIAPHRADLLEKVLRAREWIRTRRAFREIEQRFQRRRARAVSPVPTPAVEPVVSGSDFLAAVAECESGTNWTEPYESGLPGFAGAYQITVSTWAAFGGLAYASRPDYATPADQTTVAQRILEGQGAVAWPNCP